MPVTMERLLEDRDRVGVHDAVLLENYTSSSAFVENLKKRFNANLIYTYIGQVLVSVNPYNEINIYSAHHVKQYQNKNAFENSPHVFALTDRAFRSLLHQNIDQCVLISGESGSGKTEASKKILQYIADVTQRKGKVEIVKNKLLQSNPVLEAFGNARTNRNDNSSRFGKYMDIEFNYEGHPIGGNILNYLLEKSRVINQVEGERNFHIFYQLLAGADEDQLIKLNLQRSPDVYNYLTHGVKSNTHLINDKSAYNEVIKALTVIEFRSSEIDEIFHIIAAILHLGNVCFTENEGVASITQYESLQAIAKLLDCKMSDLSKALTHRTREASHDIVTCPLNCETAIYARNALAKAIYDRLFTWLVKRINASLQPEAGANHSVMGILDIYGFEIFERNSFEQLCINFCNEKLQQLFIELTLKSEQEEYLHEGIAWTKIDYFDNKVICDLVEEKHKGIIAMMDEECLRPGDTSDMTLLAKMDKNLHAHKHYISHQKADIRLQKNMGRDEFQLVHYAGTVTYNIRTFIEKNKDLLFRDLKDAMSRCGNRIIKQVFPVEEQSSKKRPETAITQFKNSLNNLMTILVDKEPNYIRCIKPNDAKAPKVFDGKLVQHQVTYLGLMENLRVRRAGFAFRRDYPTFLERYKSLAKETWPNYRGSAREGVQVLVTRLGFKNDDYKMGKTKLFVRFPKSIFDTEDALQCRKQQLASYLQAQWKGLQQRRHYRRMKNSAIIVQTWVRRFLAQRRAAKRKEAAQIIRRFIQGFITRNEAETEINRKFARLVKYEWLLKVANKAPRNILSIYWPQCPENCQETSELLRQLNRTNLARKYRLNLSPETKRQFELKVLAEKLMKNKKKSYADSFPIWFQSERVQDEAKIVYSSFAKSLIDEKIKYATMATKYDRHGYKPRERIIILTTIHIYIVEVKNSTTTVKHKLPLHDVTILITNENDRMMMIKLPQEMIKTEKGDVILQVPSLIECVTHIIDASSDVHMLSIVDQKMIEHNMKGKQGVIDVRMGKPEGIQRDKSGHLLIMTSP